MKAKSAVAGIITGIMVFFFISVLDRFFSGRSSPAGWGQLIAGVLILGILLGTIVGLIVEKTRERLPGIIAGAVILALVHGFSLTLTGLKGGFRLLGLFTGAVIGAIVSFAITSSVIETINKEESKEQE